MTVYEMQKEILRIKKEKDICILAHSYQAHEITEIADFTGDSFARSKPPVRRTKGQRCWCTPSAALPSSGLRIMWALPQA